MARKFKILVPKPAIKEEGSADMVLHKADDIVESAGKWQEEIMDTFVENGWAIEVKVDTVEETLEVEAEVKPKRARNKKGQLKADDPSTPDVNEAWEGGKAPAKKKVVKKTTKKTTTKKTTKKKA